LSFLSGTGKHFIGNIAPLHNKVSFTNPQKISRGVKSGKHGAWECVPLFQLSHQETSFPESYDL